MPQMALALRAPIAESSSFVAPDLALAEKAINVFDAMETAASI